MHKTLSWRTAMWHKYLLFLIVVLALTYIVISKPKEAPAAQAASLSGQPAQGTEPECPANGPADLCGPNANTQTIRKHAWNLLLRITDDSDTQNFWPNWRRYDRPSSVKVQGENKRNLN